MGRSGGRSGGGGGRSTGGRAPSYFGSAPSRSSHSSATSSAPTRTAERTHTNAPPPAVQSSHPPQSQHSQQPASYQQQQPSGGGGILSGIAGTVMQGMAFGGGSAIAHRAVDSIAGPRTVVHEHTGMEGQQGPQVATQAMQAIDTGDRGLNRQVESQCGDEVIQFQKCLQENRNDFNTCSFYFDVLSQCQKSVKENAQWK